MAFLKRLTGSPKPLGRLILASAAILALTASCRAEPAGNTAERSSAPQDGAKGAFASPSEAPSQLPLLGLMGTIPIYWGEADELGDLLASAEPHWARAVLEQRYTLRPLDTVDAASLAGLTHLLLAQPRALSPQENVDLDKWVREGGRVLLFADPLMTGESHFALGDRRRPQDVILLSPLLNHWGLALQFDEDQPDAVRLVKAGETLIPVKLPGRLATGASSNHEAGTIQPKSQLQAQMGGGLEKLNAFGENAGQPCHLDAEAILATCTIGLGKAWVFADAAVLDLHHPHPAASRAFAGLVEKFSEK